VQVGVPHTPGTPPLSFPYIHSPTCQTRHHHVGDWEYYSTGHGLGAVERSPVMASETTPVAFSGYLIRLPSTPSQPGTMRRSFREKGVSAGDECRSFYPVLLPKPGLRYQLGPAKTTVGRDGQMMQACNTRPQPIHGEPLPAVY
jgi:hypothetical protein